MISGSRYVPYLTKYKCHVLLCNSDDRSDQKGGRNINGRDTHIPDVHIMRSPVNVCREQNCKHTDVYIMTCPINVDEKYIHLYFDSGI